MPWYHNLIPEDIKKSVLTYLIHRYAGQFFEEKLGRDQLKVELLNGRGSVEKIKLDVQALNKLAESLNCPFEFVDGSIECLSVYIPWTGILKNSSYVDVHGLKITVKPKQLPNTDTEPLAGKFWSSSMTSSIQLAQECAELDAASSSTKTAQLPYEGLEIVAQTIDSILRRVCVKFFKTVIQIEHVPKGSTTGVGVKIDIDLIEYSDESGKDPPTEEATDLSNEDKKAYLVQSFTTKKFVMSGINFYTVEFSTAARRFSQTKTVNNEESASEKNIMSENDCVQETKEAEVENEKKEKSFNAKRHVIMFGRLISKQEIRIRLKQEESLAGPKVAIDINFNSLLLFLSPRQFHLLVELASGLASPDNQDTSNVATPKSKLISKPMTTSDFQKVEQDLNQQLLLEPLSNTNVPGFLRGQGWSSHALDESESDDKFFPMENAVNEIYDTANSVISSSMDSSVTSLASTATEVTQRTKRRTHNVDIDPTAELSHFQIHLSSIGIILLHEDLLIPSAEGNLSVSSVRQMQITASHFFNHHQMCTVAVHEDKEFIKTKKIFGKACTLNHLRLLAAPLQIEVHQKTTLSGVSVTATLAAAKLQLHECLYDSQNPVHVIPLLTFTDNVQIQNSDSEVKPNFKMTIKHIDKVSRKESDITFSLSKCLVEFDITIIDRIAALIHPPVICEKSGTDLWNDSPGSQLQMSSSPNSATNLKILSPLINFRIRFPIPDFRSSMIRTPWWKRNIRPDFISVVLSDATLGTMFRTNQAFQEYHVQSYGLEIIYYETENGVGLPLAKSGLENKSATPMANDTSLQSRLSIKIFPKKAPDLEEPKEPERDPMTTSFYGAFENQTSQQPGPFSAKKVVHESDTPHPKPHKDDGDELIIPGDKHEIEEFIHMTTNSCLLEIEIFLPMISLHLQAKHIYELIYNRINNDLLLWEPSAPRSKSDMYENVNTVPFKHLERNIVIEGRDTFVLCKSGIQYESGSDTEEGSDDSASNLFYSACDHKLKASIKHQQPPVSTSVNPKKSRVVLTITIGHGLVCLNAPARDVTTNNVLPGQQGEFVLNFEDANVFVVSGYQGDEDLGYVCVQVHNAQLYHCEMMPTPSQYPPIMPLGSVIGRHLHPTIYSSERGMAVCSKNRGGSREMLTVAIKIEANHETHQVKVVKIALGINKCTLRHKMCNEPNSWISQLLDFFNVHDYPVPGYQAKDVLTEIHLHLWDCAIDYRPLNIPVRCAITVGNFSMSSHLSALSNSSTLRFIFEECGLFLSEKAPPRNGVASLAPVDLQRDYVNVIEMGLFELSLKTNDKKSGVYPHIDLRASNNILNIHTCADSCRMLMQLITYFANDGDLISSSMENADSIHSSPKHEVEQQLVTFEPQNISNLSKSQHEHVNNLIGEAMEENVEPEEKNVPVVATGAQLFFFPDEHQMAELESLGKPLPQVTVELGDTTYLSNKSSSDTDDDFCIIGNEPGLGMFPKSGLPEIQWLTSDPVRVVETHFSVPLGKTDLLKTPKHYPTPVMRYTLCDMTLVWHMYGGHDFKVPENDKKKTVNFTDEHLDDVVSFKNVDTTEVKFTNALDRKKAKMPWTLRGGVNRNHNVHMELQLNKVRFQHEQYPDNTVQASRQVLIISELEIRDRLQCSQINKFLYQYTSQARPKQSHANMVVIKALHIKPDPRLSTQECCLKISLLPLRLNIDQDALLFLITFFNELSGSSTPEEQQFSSSKHNTPTHHPPVMTISEGNEEEIKRQAQKVVNDNLILLMEEKKLRKEEEELSETSTLGGSVADSSPIYFRNVIFSPDVHIRLDYHGKRVDMTHGPLPGLLMGLGQLNCSEIRMKRLIYRHGLLGFDKLMGYLLQEWINDIKKNQLPSLLGGVGPMYSLVQLFQGVRDLFWLPIEQYQKDGRIVRGLQRGANSFTTSTAMAALELTTRLIHLIQITAETAYDMLSPGPSLRRLAKAKGKKKRYHQPQDIREGMTNAYMLVREGIGETADNIVQVAALEKERKGYSGAVGGVLRQIPPTVLKPIIIASEATNNVLGGVRCQLVPDARQEANQKWRSDES